METSLSYLNESTYGEHTSRGEMEFFDMTSLATATPLLPNAVYFNRVFCDIISIFLEPAEAPAMTRSLKYFTFFMMLGNQYL